MCKLIPLLYDLERTAFKTWDIEPTSSNPPLLYATWETLPIAMST